MRRWSTRGPYRIPQHVKARVQKMDPRLSIEWNARRGYYEFLYLRSIPGTSFAMGEPSYVYHPQTGRRHRNLAAILIVMDRPPQMCDVEKIKSWDTVNSRPKDWVRGIREHNEEVEHRLEVEARDRRVETFCKPAWDLVSGRVLSKPAQRDVPRPTPQLILPPGVR